MQKRPVMDGSVIDEKEQKFMLSLFKKEVHVSRCRCNNCVGFIK